jgi:hypothetical protein
MLMTNTSAVFAVSTASNTQYLSFVYYSIHTSLLKGPTYETMAPKPDNTCYEYVLDTCIAAGMKDVALKTFTAMEQRHIEPTERMYAALVRGFGDALELESALGVSSITCKFTPASAGLQYCAVTLQMDAHASDCAMLVS